MAISSAMKSNPKSILADNLSYLMDRHKSLDSQKKLANKSGVAQSTIGRILRKETDATIETLEAVANCFGLSAGALLAIPTFCSKDRQISEPSKATYSATSHTAIPVVSLEWLSDPDFDIWGDKDITATISCEPEITSNSFAVYMPDDSMTAQAGLSIPRGYQLIIDPGSEVMNGTVIICHPNRAQAATIRQIIIDGDIRYLKPLNHNYRVTEMGEEDRIIGVAIHIQNSLKADGP